MHVSKRTMVLFLVTGTTIVLSMLLTLIVVYTGAYAISEMIFAVSGLLVSIYLVLYQYLRVPLACPRSGLVDCRKVLDSKYSFLARNIRTSVLGLLFFPLMIAAVLIGNHPLVVLFSFAGLIYTFERIYTQYRIGSICLYCTFTYIMVVSMLMTALISA
ncbi:MAG: hypothetical protein KGH72_00280 [Candidatus Micrarchaeota archaeon]|nr:hypothetical protein [Candidatus Micrarchaeota archaeon]